MPGTASSSERLLESLERLLRIPTGDFRSTMVHATDVIAEALRSDKVDAFIYDSTRDSLAAISSSNQPLSALQRKLGLEVLQVANGGRVVWVYQTGKTFVSGRLQEDPEELRGVKEGLRIQSKIGVPLEIAGKRRGMVMIASLEADYYSADDVRYAETVVRWIGILAHRAELAEQMRRNAVDQSRRAVAEEMVAMVAHDMRNYLSPIELRLQGLRRIATRKHSQEELIAELDRVSQSTTQLRTLVSDLLDVARLDHGLFQLNPGLADLSSLVNESARALSRPDVSVDVRVQSMGEILVLADTARLRQCIDNLIANAIEQSPHGGTVTVIIATETTERGEEAQITVIDEGPGVPPEVLPQIFERHVTSKASSGGLGLGLFLAKRVAELHGGDLSVESSVGQGARFRLRLPCQLR